jgi:hypothetical protein
MRVRFLKPHGNFKPGYETNVPWASVGVELIRRGIALAVEPCDLHLNPPSADATPGAEPTALEQPTDPARTRRRR